MPLPEVIPVKAGTRETVLKPRTAWAVADGTVALPGRALARGGALPTGWNDVEDTQNGVLITPRDPTVPWVSDERGRIANLPGDDPGITMAFNDRSPAWNLISRLGRWEKTSLALEAAVTGTGAHPEYPQTDIYGFRPGEIPRQIMIMVEGEVQRGGLFNVKTMARFLAFYADPTAGVPLAARSRGNDSPVVANIALECMPGDITSAMLTGTGIPSDAIKTDERAVWMMIPEEAVAP